MKTYIMMAVAFATALFLSHCGGGTEVSNPVSTSTKLVSTSLDEGSLEPSDLRKAAKRKAVSSDCGGSLVNCLTPTNVSGQVFYAGLLVGIIDGYSVGPIIGDVIDPSQITSFDPTTLYNFDLIQQLAVDGDIICCGGAPYPADDDALLQSTHVYFSYADTSFTLETEDGVAAELVGDHVIRTVFGDIDGTEMQKGDLLYKASGSEDYLWCTSDEGCIFDARPSVPLQYADIANYAGTPDGLGNQTIPSFFANLADGHADVVITESQLQNNSLTITVDFDMTNAIGFTAEASSLTSVADMVGSFGLGADPGDQDGGFTSSVIVEMTPLPEGESNSADEQDEENE